MITCEVFNSHVERARSVRNVLCDTNTCEFELNTYNSDYAHSINEWGSSTLGLGAWVYQIARRHEGESWRIHPSPRILVARHALPESKELNTARSEVARSLTLHCLAAIIRWLPTVNKSRVYGCRYVRVSNYQSLQPACSPLCQVADAIILMVWVLQDMICSRIRRRCRVFRHCYTIMSLHCDWRS